MRLYRINIVLTVLLLLTSVAYSQIVTVTSTVDDATAGVTQGTLRYAVNQVNAGVADEIQFDFPSAGPHVISLYAALPQITHTSGVFMITIDGFNQNAQYPGNHQVVIDGGNQNFDGLTSFPPTWTGTYGMDIKNLILKGFGDPSVTTTSRYSAIKVVSNFATVGSNNRLLSVASKVENNIIIDCEIGIYYPYSCEIVSNYIGVDQFMNAHPNRYGIFIENTFSAPGYVGETVSSASGTWTIIGLPSKGNFICSNVKDGIYNQNNKLEINSNYIGTDQYGNNHGNGGAGIKFVDDHNENHSNWIGYHVGCATSPSYANEIAFNGEDGIYITGAVQQSANAYIYQNKIHSNSGSPINLNYNVSSPPYPGNSGLPVPVITSFDPSNGSASGTVGSGLPQGSLIEVFKSNANGEAISFLGCTTTDASQNWSISGLNTSTANYIVATVTEEGSSPSQPTFRTSELSDPIFQLNCNQYNLSAEFSLSTNQPTVGQPLTLTYTGTGSNVISFVIDWGDGNQTNGNQTPSGGLSNGSQYGHTYSFAATVSITMEVLGPQPCKSVEVLEIDVSECCIGDMKLMTSPGEPLQQTGKFYFDNQTGQLIFKKLDCPAVYEYSCLQKQTSPIDVDGVIDVSMVTLSDHWGYWHEFYPPNTSWSPDPFENGSYGKWRVSGEYHYNINLDEGLLAQLGSSNPYSVNFYKNFDRGTFSIEMFDWDYPNNNNPNKWVRSNRITGRTPNGFVDEDENLRGKKSAAQYGYDNKLLTVVADRASRTGVSFESFERTYEGNTKFENNATYESSYCLRSSDKAHSGKYSLKMLSSSIGNGGVILGRIRMNHNLVNYGVLVRAWVWVHPDKKNLIKATSYRIKLSVAKECGSCTYQLGSAMDSIAQVGEWTLYEYLVPTTLINSAGITASSVSQSVEFMSLKVRIDGWGGSEGYVDGDIFIDDVRIGPKEASYECYVYDPIERIVAKFDDQHFGLFYQYNAEGALVRKLKETERGVKTISETNYNSQGEDNYN